MYLNHSSYLEFSKIWDKACLWLEHFHCKVFCYYGRKYTKEENGNRIAMLIISRTENLI